MLNLSWLLPLATLSHEKSALKKEIRGNKKGKCPEPQKKRKSETRGKNGQVSDSTHLRGKKNEIESISFSSQSFKKQGRYVSPQRAKVELDFHHCYHHHHHHTPFIRHTCTS